MKIKLGFAKKQTTMNVNDRLKMNGLDYEFIDAVHKTINNKRSC